MKIRTSFVSNSSSCSFIIPTTKEFDDKFNETYQMYSDSEVREYVINSWIRYYFCENIDSSTKNKIIEEINNEYDNALDVLRNYKEYSKIMNIDELKNQLSIFYDDFDICITTEHELLTMNIYYDIHRISKIIKVDFNSLKEFISYDRFRKSLIKMYLGNIPYERFMIAALEALANRCFSHYEEQKIKKVLKGSDKKLVSNFKNKIKRIREKLLKYDKFYVLKISDGGDSGHVNNLIEKKFIKIPSIYVENNH